MAQAEVCKVLNMKVHTLSQIENDKGKYRESTIKKLLTFYGMNPEYIK